MQVCQTTSYRSDRRSVASDLGLHCLPVTRLGVSSLQWISRGTAFPTISHMRPVKTHILVKAKADLSLRCPSVNALDHWPPTEGPAKTDQIAWIRRLM